VKSLIKRILRLLGLELTRVKGNEFEFRKTYLRYKEYTMISEKTYVDNLRLASRFSGINGCVVECGVWRGGMIAGIAETVPGRKYYLFDSFEGLPPAKSVDGDAALKWQGDTGGPSFYDNCRAEIEFAQRAMGLADANAEIIKGWFNETLPATKINEPIAILRIDGDWYDSTMDCLINLFPVVAQGGLIIIDDYYTWDGCSKAVHDYLSMNKLNSRIYRSYGGVAYMVKLD